MPWARFADDYLGNAKLTTLSTAAIALDVTGIIYSARELRDGHLSTNDVQVVASLIHLRRWVQAVAELVMARRWIETAAGWDIHDYLEYQPSREQVLADRTAAAQRMRRVRANSGRSPGEVQPEFGRSSTTPYPVPVPDPEVPTELPGAPPNPPRKRRGRNSSETVGFEHDGPKYEQRPTADGKREWVAVP
jgi:hypothetical protein